MCPDLFRFVLVPAHAERPPRKRVRADLYEDATPPTDQLLLEFTDAPIDTGRATAKRVVPATAPVSEAAATTIQRRNATFARALAELIAACRAQGHSAVDLVYDAAQSYLPGTAPPPPCPVSAPTVHDVLVTLPQLPWWREQIVPGGRRTFAPRAAAYAAVDPALGPTMTSALAALGIHQLYTHQAEALSAFRRGQHVVVCTGTASGKSLVYQVPIAEAAARGATALCLFPTKALTQDQLTALGRLLRQLDMGDTPVDAYDGDTPADERRAIRMRAGVVFTNPDMLHTAILPNEEQWRTFFAALRVVVVDELHVYSGTFGTHVAFVLRRLRRLCAALGNTHVQFVSCSATIDAPGTHMAALLALAEVDVHVVSTDGAPTGRKEWALWNAPPIDAADPSHGRASAYDEASRLVRFLMAQGWRLIVFTKVRRTCEILVRQLREDLAREGRADLVERVHGYRGGYAPADRRGIEHDMAQGAILALVATSALELGVDIGALDAVVLFGVPYTAASMWQQAGRAGRRQRDALVVLVAEPFAVDQYYMRNPAELFEARTTPLWLDTQNELLLEQHLVCAAHEVPVCADDAAYFGPATLAVARRVLQRDRDDFFYARTDAPALDVPLRGARQTTYRYVDMHNTLLEEVEFERVYFEAYEGAVFLHQGTTYLCRGVNHEARIAHMERADVRYHTRPRDFTDVDPTETWRIRTLEHAGVWAYYGRITITARVFGYFKVDRRAQILDEVAVDAAPIVSSTQGVWIDVPWTIVEAIAAHGINAPAAIHAAEHALLSLTPMFVASAADDVRTDCKVPIREMGPRPTTRKRPARLIWYDRPGLQAGASAQLFLHLDTLLRIALRAIESCPCVDGCPGCIHAPSCSSDALRVDDAPPISAKLGAQAMLRGLLRRPMFDKHEPPRHDRARGDAVLPRTEALAHTLCASQPVPAEAHVVVEQMIER